MLTPSKLIEAERTLQTDRVAQMSDGEIRLALAGVMPTERDTLENLKATAMVQALRVCRLDVGAEPGSRKHNRRNKVWMTVRNLAFTIAVCERLGADTLADAIGRAEGLAVV